MKRSRIIEDWQPSARCAAFARDLELDPAALVGPFVDHHLAKGSLMADWEAAWRTWCRNDVKFAQRRAPGLALFAVVTGGQPAAAGDSFGAIAWSKTLQDATEAEGKRWLGGYNGHGVDVAGWAADLCEAAKMDPTRVAGGLSVAAEWLREHKSPYWIEDLIKRARKPAGGVKSLEYFRQPVADQAARDRGERQEALL